MKLNSIFVLILFNRGYLAPRFFIIKVHDVCNIDNDFSFKLVLELHKSLVSLLQRALDTPKYNFSGSRSSLVVQSIYVDLGSLSFDFLCGILSDYEKLENVPTFAFFSSLDPM